MNISEFLARMLRKNFEIILKKPTRTKIQKIRFILTTIIEQYSTDLPGFLSNYKDDLINTLILAYLEIWLQNDAKNKLTIDKYISSLPEMQSQLSKEEFEANIDKESLRRQMHRGKDLLMYMYSSENNYCKENNFIYTPPVIHPGKRTTYSLVELEAMYNFGFVGFGIFKDIFKNAIPYFSKNEEKNV